MITTFRDVTQCWSVLYDDLANINHNIDDFYQSQPRGRKCNETIGITFRIIEPQNCLMWSKVRRLSPIYLAKEWKWYHDGDRDPKNAPAKVWLDLANQNDPDKGLVNSNYGSYIFTQKDAQNENMSVWEYTKKLLQDDKDTRQAVIQIPSVKYRGTKDTPCTLSGQFILRNNKLNFIVLMRSQDIWYGFPNDMTNFIMWQMEMANELGVDLGWFQIHIGSCHVYEENFIKDFDKYKEDFEDTYILGEVDKQNRYLRFYDDRDYRITLAELHHDFNILIEKSRDEILKDDLLYSKELQFMLENMKISKFIR